MGAHSRLSPSDASRWMNCAGAINRVKKLGIVDQRTSKAAAEGTAMHLIREFCLDLGFEPHDFIGEMISADGFTFEVTEEFAEFLQPGIDRCRELTPVGATTGVELRADITPWLGLDDHGRPQGGTIDYYVIGSSLMEYLEEWVLSDLKFGAGIPVSPVRNKQQMLYALGLINSFPHLKPPKRVRIIIDQPRNGGGGGEWVVSIDELRAFGEEVKKAAKATLDPNAPCTPSAEACLWCPLSRLDNACPEYEAWNLDFLGLEFDDLDALEDGEDLPLPEIDGMTPERRRKINAHAHVVKKWLDRLHASEIADVLELGELCGMKVVEGRRGKRKHVDEDDSEAWLRKRGFSDEQIFTKKLIGFTLLDKLVGKGNFPKSLVVQGNSKPVLVPVEDERPALVGDFDFDNLDDEDGDFDF